MNSRGLRITRCALASHFIRYDRQFPESKTLPLSEKDRL